MVKQKTKLISEDFCPEIWRDFNCKDGFLSLTKICYNKIVIPDPSQTQIRQTPRRRHLKHISTFGRYTGVCFPI